MPTSVNDLRIDEEELFALALDLANIDSPSGREGEVGQFVYDWMVETGIPVRKIGLLPERFNVLGRIPGTDEGYSLIFNSHLDTGRDPGDRWSMRHADAPIYHSAWRRDGRLYGEGIVNDKGPMAAWLMAVKAILQGGAELKGDLLLSAVPGEIGVEPVDEFEAPRYMSKEVGTRWLIQHGGVADYALVAEGTDFRTTWIEAGKAFFKVTIYGEDQIYTPFGKDDPVDFRHPNAIVRCALILPRVQEWAREYQKRYRYESRGGTIEPKVVIGAIRGGNPYHVTRTAELCSLYLDVRIVPNQDPLEIMRELKALIQDLGVPGDVELFLYRRAYEAEDPGALLQSIQRSHRDMFGTETEMADPVFSSMWRDLLLFNEMGIPAITYGPGVAKKIRAEEGPGDTPLGGHLNMPEEDLVKSAHIYAAIALDLCNTDKPRRAPPQPPQG
jgi:acetylornithine deacetylase/succinyl-diaminopimelate desuccinylase-like protein